MEMQNGTVDRPVEEWADGPGGLVATMTTPTVTTDPPSVDLSVPGAAPGVPPVPDGAEGADGPGGAALTGSLSVFSLADVLSMLASADQTGELRVVSEAVDGRVWIDHGELADADVGTSASVSQAVFELACATGGSFSFAADRLPAPGRTPVGGESPGATVSVATVLAEVGPRVEEWRTVRALLPPEAVVTLSPEPPGEDVRIRHDQWRVLTQVGTSGHSVGSVLDAIGGDPMVGLRTLRDLHAAGLIDLQPLPSVGVLGEAPLPPPPPPPTGADEDGSPSLPPPATMVTRDATPETDDGSIHPERSGGLADVSIMPPPIADDPWAPVAPSGEPEQDGVA